MQYCRELFETLRRFFKEDFKSQFCSLTMSQIIPKKVLYNIAFLAQLPCQARHSLSRTKYTISLKTSRMLKGAKYIYNKLTST